MTTFFRTDAARAVVDSWSTRLFSVRTSEILMIRREDDGDIAAGSDACRTARPMALPAAAAHDGVHPNRRRSVAPRDLPAPRVPLGASPRRGEQAVGDHLAAHGSRPSRAARGRPRSCARRAPARAGSRAPTRCRRTRTSGPGTGRCCVPHTGLAMSTCHWRCASWASTADRWAAFCTSPAAHPTPCSASAPSAAATVAAQAARLRPPVTPATAARSSPPRAGHGQPLPVRVGTTSLTANASKGSSVPAARATRPLARWSTSAAPTSVVPTSSSGQVEVLTPTLSCGGPRGRPARRRRPPGPRRGR